jgi:16S rRNA (guanine527-N7)-methyltransferase
MAPPPFEAIAKFGVSRESYDKLLIFEKLLLNWQPHINLIAPSTIPDLWNRHIIDSLQLFQLLPKHASAIADLGSGGGFPGLVLAITQDALVHFYESNTKKTAPPNQNQRRGSQAAA